MEDFAIDTRDLLLFVSSTKKAKRKDVTFLKHEMELFLILIQKLAYNSLSCTSSGLLACVRLCIFFLFGFASFLYPQLLRHCLKTVTTRASSPYLGG